MTQLGSSGDGPFLEIIPINFDNPCLQATEITL
jgi:hypothetical protein